MIARVFFRMLAAWATLVGAAALAAKLPERRIFQFGEFTIEASAGDDAYVEALALRLADFHWEPPPAAPALRLSLDDLATRREYFLGHVAAWLGLAKPTENMAQVFDLVLSAWRNARIAMPKTLPRHFALWRRAELIARLEAGEKISGFTVDATGGLTFSFEFNYAPGPGREVRGEDVGAAAASFWSGFVCPLKIDAEGGKTPAEEIATSLDEVIAGTFAGWRNSMVNAARLGVFNVLHEAAESGIVWHYITSKDRRWFCDGVANFVAFKMIAAEVGPDDARNYYDLPAELQKYAADTPRIDLAAWPAAEDEEHMNYPAELDAANYAFATKVVAGLTARHGDDILPRLFKEIGRTRREKTTIETVYRACKRLTGEDLRADLAIRARGE